MKIKQILFLSILLIAFSCEERRETFGVITAATNEANEDSNGIPDDIENRPFIVVSSIQEITTMAYPFYFLDADNYLHVYNEATLVCPYSYDYDAAQHVKFEDLGNFTGVIALDYDTLMINDGVVNYKEDKKPGNPKCKDGDIRRKNSGGSKSVPEKCPTKSGKMGSQTCTVKTIDCVRPDGTVYKAEGSAGDCSKCKKDKKGNKIGEIETECGF